MVFFSNFFGDDSRKDLAKADKKATGFLDRGYNQQTQRYDQAAGMYDPYVSEGRAASTRYNSLLGLNGADAATGAYDDLASLPMFQGQLATESNALARNLNARGMGGGGTAALAGQRVFQQTAGNWLDRYRDAGRQGFEATNQGANIRMGQGDAAMGYGATRANQAIGYGNALSQTRSAGLNNLVGLIGAAGKAATAFKPGP